MRLARFLCTAIVLASCDIAFGVRDDLSSGWWDKPLNYTVRYRRLVEQKLARGFGRDVLVRTIHLPPFDPEWVVGVVRSPNGYRAFRLDASYFIWQAMLDEKDKLRTIHGIYKDRPIPVATALRLAALWRHVITDRRNYAGKADIEGERVIYGDSSHFVFSVGSITANTTKWDRGTKAGELVRVGDDIYNYVVGKKTEVHLERSLGLAERNVGLR